MDERAARELVERVGAELGDRVVLWRGPSLSGSDVDLLVLDGGDAPLGRLLAASGLERRPGGHWSTAAGDVTVDPLPARDWPAAYPELSGVVARARAQGPLPPVAAPEDRFLILAAEAVAGRPLAKLLPKLRELAADQAALERARALARSEGAESLASLAAQPDSLERAAARGVLPYRRALAAGLASRRGRAALRQRIAATAERRLRRLRTSGR